MKMKFYHQEQNITSGITLKDPKQLENYNMALHSCQNEEDVIHNRQQLAAALHVSLTDFVVASQTHSDHVYEVKQKDKGSGASSQTTAIPDTDALYTFEQDLVLGTFTADCVPVIFYSETDGVIGVIHSGWQGSVKEITKKVFHHLVIAAGCDLTTFQVQIGMAISQDKFEVDADVYTLFHRLRYADEEMYFDAMKQKYFINNKSIVKKQCILAGIPAKNITIDPECTFTAAHGFSYREDRQAGRHMSFIVRRG